MRHSGIFFGIFKWDEFLNVINDLMIKLFFYLKSWNILKYFRIFCYILDVIHI